eukprot:Skav226881  [mRNA]  locus=scaffold1187:341567:342780:+ [translate_table: standard]
MLRVAGYGKSDLSVEKKRRALSEGAERRELLMDYRASVDDFVKSEQDKIRKAQISMLEEQLPGREKRDFSKGKGSQSHLTIYVKP